MQRLALCLINFVQSSLFPFLNKTAEAEWFKFKALLQQKAFLDIQHLYLPKAQLKMPTIMPLTLLKQPSRPISPIRLFETSRQISISPVEKPRTNSPLNRLTVIDERTMWLKRLQSLSGVFKRNEQRLQGGGLTSISSRKDLTEVYR